MIVEFDADEDLSQLGVCVKSGIPTSDTILLAGRASPRWLPLALVVGGMPGWAFAERRTATRFQLVLVVTAAW